MIGCQYFNPWNESNKLEIKSNINLDKSIDLKKGTYYCKKCNLKLYNFFDKLNSNNDNESFDKPSEGNVEFNIDYMKIKLN